MGFGLVSTSLDGPQLGIQKQKTIKNRLYI